MNSFIQKPVSVFLVLLVPYHLVYMEELLIFLYEMIVFRLKYCGCLMRTAVLKGNEIRRRTGQSPSLLSVKG